METPEEKCTQCGVQKLNSLHRISLFTYLLLGARFFYYFKQIDVKTLFALISTLFSFSVFLKEYLPCYGVKQFFMLMNKWNEFLRSVCLFLKITSCLLNSILSLPKVPNHLFQRHSSCFVILSVSHNVKELPALCHNAIS